MSKLGVVEYEYNYIVNAYTEAFELIAQDATYYEIDSETKDKNYDPTVEYKSAREIGVIFVDNPKPILKQYGWVIEDKNTVVVFISPKDRNLDLLDVKEHTVFDVESKYGIQSEKRFFITNVTGSTIDPFMFICTAVPYRKRVVPEDTSNRETGSSYLKIRV